MANWISSKLKAAENILQQIDNQAAESLRKNERLRSEEPRIDSTAKTSGAVSLKDQLKKRPPEDSNYQGKLRGDPNFSQINDAHKDIASAPKASPKSVPALTDGDWTQLLSTPNPPTASGSNHSNGVTAIRGLNKNNRRPKNLSSNLLVPEVKKNQKSGNNASKSSSKLDTVKELKLSGKGKASDGEESTSSGSAGRHSNVESETDGRQARKQGLGGTESATRHVMEQDRRESEENGSSVDYSKLPPPESLQSLNKMRDTKTAIDIVQGQSKSTIKGKNGLDAVSGNSTSDDLRTVSSVLSDVSDSDTDFSSSGSESEHEREERKRRRERILAEKAAAKAIEAIKEREDMVAKLEGEKQSLEKIVEERAKQQAQEASQLQTTMMETMEAVELEKQKHNNTRMEVLGRLAKQETANADLARSLAAAQWNLEVEVKRVAELRQQIVSKELVHEELRRSIKNPSQTGSSKNQLALKGVEFEREILEAEYSFINDKVAQLQDKARKLEADIELTRKDIEEPTEVEVELKRRLSQMTDHLIQKQAKVEALSSEKASLVFRIETVSRLLDENMSSASTSMDLESGIWQLSNSKLKPMLQERYRSGKKQLVSLLRQLDHVFVVGALFLRRNPRAKLWSLVYVICLHFWVLYIFMSHSGASNEGRSGAVISLENINNTGA
ncbi:golgin candidate 2 [Prosopis cineraria]|uniref:golgin candidate 2 n=1 Tax=Prosopis cineraria TaxID=364024 RepID=UPI00240F6886|nr:golgin candidate 2 [Prosopis cineraria]